MRCIIHFVIFIASFDCLLRENTSPDLSIYYNIYVDRYCC